MDVATNLCIVSKRDEKERKIKRINTNNSSTKKGGWKEFFFHLDGSLQLKQNGLRDENFAGFGAQVSNLGLEQLNLFAGTAASHFEKAIDYRVEIDLMLVSHSREVPWRELARRYRVVGRRWRVGKRATMKATVMQADARDVAAAGESWNAKLSGGALDTMPGTSGISIRQAASAKLVI